jgi:1-acyl-sn-glycerol-3-phosphate acyltransferase
VIWCDVTSLDSSLPTLDDLIWLNTGDICAALGLAQGTPLRGLAELACRPPARRFAQQMLHLDSLVGTAGLRTGGAWICDQLSDGLEVRGAPPPPHGALLVVANHPGLLDAAALFAALGRSDLRVLAITRPFLRALPNIAGHLFAVGTTPGARTAAVRAAGRHLRTGGALLTFPAGRIEPDPRSMAGAEASLADWSASLDLLVRMAGPVTVLPTIVSGVISSAALRHPLTRLRRNQRDRQWLAAILQLIWPPLQRTSVRVTFGHPLKADASPLSAAVVAEARRLIGTVNHP